MDEAMVSIWINLVLIPWGNTWDLEVVPLLVLDTYHDHMMGSTVNCMQVLGIGVQHIMGGCTYLCQTMDFGINRSIKKEMTDQWEEWLITGGGVEDGVA